MTSTLKAKWNSTCEGAYAKRWVIVSIGNFWTFAVTLIVLSISSAHAESVNMAVHAHQALTILSLGVVFGALSLVMPGLVIGRISTRQRAQIIVGGSVLAGSIISALSFLAYLMGAVRGVISIPILFAYPPIISWLALIGSFKTVRD